MEHDCFIQVILTTVEPRDAGRRNAKSTGQESTGMLAISGDLEQHNLPPGPQFPFCKLGVTGQQLHTHRRVAPTEALSGPDSDFPFI